jgi:hypothetical protein
MKTVYQKVQNIFLYYSYGAFLVYCPSLIHVDTQLLMHSGPRKQLRYSTF